MKKPTNIRVFAYSIHNHYTGKTKLMFSLRTVNKRNRFVDEERSNHKVGSRCFVKNEEDKKLFKQVTDSKVKVDNKRLMADTVI